MYSTNPVLGISLMIVAMAVNSSKDGIAKLLASNYSPLTILFLQFIATSVILAPFIIKKNNISTLVPKQLLPQIYRSSFVTIGVGLYYWAINFIGIADATAMIFVAPLIVTALSPSILKEPIGFRRAIAIIIGFIGVIIILRPTMDSDRSGYFIALASGLFLAAYYIANRKLASTTPILASTFYSSSIGIILLAPLLPLFWTLPAINDIWLLLIFAILATLGQVLMIGAFSFAAASIIAPFVYTQIIWATMVGYFLFGTFPDKWGWGGITIVVATGIYIAIREISLEKD